MNTAPLLIEILTQELPAIPFLKEFPHIATKWQHSLQAHHIPPCQTQVFFTPRRLVLFAPDFPLFSQDTCIEAFGAPIKIAFENGVFGGTLSKAGLSFLTKHNLDPKTDMDKISIAKKDGKEVLYFKHTRKGVDSQILLQDIFIHFLQSLHFGKTMRWGNIKEDFIRPVENICAFLGETPLALNAFGIDSKPQTFGHRDMGFAPLPIKNITHYFDTLATHKVILDQNKRKELILSQIKDLQHTHNIKVELDSALLAEVVAITEYPQSLLGRFDKKFLTLPQEVIITSMKENQRYFTIYKDNALFNGFIVVTNSTNSDTSLIIAGNEKVLRARLSDAMFFYHNDLRTGLNPEGLKNIIFVQGLGTLAQKSQRELQIAQYLYTKYTKNFTLEYPHIQPSVLQKLLEQSIIYAKADLLTEMVGEFPELQGIMGSYYTLALGQDSLIAQAIKEQYLPNSEDSELPSNLLSALVSLSSKLDSICALFSINKIPTGSKDPYALRRAANGIIKIIQDKKLAFNIREDIKTLYDTIGYAPINTEMIEHFFLERLEHILALNPSIFTSTLLGLDSHNLPQRDINTLTQNALALNEVFHNTQDKPALLSTFKRVANICKDIDIHTLDSVQPSLFCHNAEHTLFNTFIKITQDSHKDVLAHTKALFELKSALADFFDNVLINDKDSKLRANRYALIGSIYREFLHIGDIAHISI